MSSKTLKIIAFSFVVIFSILLISLHFLDKTIGYNTSVVSNFALGNFGWLFFTSLVFLSLAKCFLAVLVGRVTSEPKLSKWIQFLVLFSASTNFLIGVFPIGNSSNQTIYYLHIVFAVLSFLATGIFLTLFVFFNNNENKFKIFLKSLICILYLTCLAAFPFATSSLVPIMERILIFLLISGIVINIALV